jgi:hypothetical protein
VLLLKILLQILQSVGGKRIGMFDALLKIE